MEPEVELPSKKIAGWTYTEITVRDGERILKPTHVCADEIIFREPPLLQSAEISVTITNGDRQTTRIARVLPHEINSIRVPIQLINASLLGNLQADCLSVIA